jgi:serine/threonine protein kinase
MIGESIGSYRITAKLGEGGLGEVYLARDTKLGRDASAPLLLLLRTRLGGGRNDILHP